MSAADGLPRGAVAVVLVGILMTGMVAWASDESIVSSSELAWHQSYEGVVAPDGPVDLGDTGAATLSSSGIDVTEPNSEGERLFQVGIELRITPAGAPMATEAACAKTTRPPTVNARTPNRPAAFPGVIEELELAEWPSEADVNHRDQGSPFSRVQLPAEYDDYGTVEGVSVGWGTWTSGRQLWHWTVPAEAATEPVALRAVSLWRTVDLPAVDIICEVERGSRRAMLATRGDLSG